MVRWQHALEHQRVHSRRMETLTFPLEVKNGPFSENFSPLLTSFTPGGPFPFFETLTSSPFSEKATKRCHTFLHGEAILLAPLFPHSPFSENPFSDLGKGVTTPNVI